MCGTPGTTAEHDRETLPEQGFPVQEREDGVEPGPARLIRWVQEHEVVSRLIGGPAFEERPNVRTMNGSSVLEARASEVVPHGGNGRRADIYEHGLLGSPRECLD